mgnify:CR=1 FL=1
MSFKKKNIVVKEKPLRHYEFQGRNCVSYPSFFREVENCFGIQVHDLASLKRVMLDGDIIYFPSRIVIKSAAYASGECPQWPDILAIFMNQSLVARGCECIMENDPKAAGNDYEEIPFPIDGAPVIFGKTKKKGERQGNNDSGNDDDSTE